VKPKGEVNYEHGGNVFHCFVLFFFFNLLFFLLYQAVTELESLKSQVVEVSAGDAMYLPRGRIHEAATNCSVGDKLHPSVHLTVGIEVANTGSIEILLHHAIDVFFHQYSSYSGNSSLVIFGSVSTVELKGICLPGFLHVLLYVVAGKSKMLRRSVYSVLRLQCPLVLWSIDAISSLDLQRCLSEILYESILEVKEFLSSRMLEETLTFIGSLFGSEHIYALPKSQSTKVQRVQVKEVKKLHSRVLKYINGENIKIVNISELVVSDFRNWSNVPNFQDLAECDLLSCLWKSESSNMLVSLISIEAIQAHLTSLLEFMNYTYLKCRLFSCKCGFVDLVIFYTAKKFGIIAPD
jgi:hypothetical protein